MANLTYTPLREVVGDGGSIDFSIMNDPFKPKPVVVHDVPLGGGKGATKRHRNEKVHQIQAGYIPASLIAYFEEFEASCAAGELFTLTSLNPERTHTRTYTGQLVNNTYSVQPVGNQNYIVNFRFRQIGDYFDLPLPEVGDIYWSLDQPAGYLYRNSGSDFELTTPVSLSTGDKVKFNVYTTEWINVTEPLVANETGAENNFNIKAGLNGEITFEGCSVSVNGKSVVNGEAQVFLFADVYEIEATINTTTNIKWLYYDGVSIRASLVYIDSLEVQSGNDNYSWPLNTRLQNQPESNIGSNDIIINSYSAAWWTDKAWNANEAKQSLSGVADAVYPGIATPDNIVAGGSSLKNDDSGSSFDFNSLGQVRCGAFWSYQDGFTIEFLMRADAVQLASPATQGQMALGINALNNLFANTLWCVRWDDFANAGGGLKPCFSILKRDSLYSVETDNPEDVEAEVRGSENLVIGRVYHMLATFRPSDNSFELWVDGVSIGSDSIPAAWWDDGGQATRNLLDGSDDTIIDLGIGYIDGAWRSGNTAMQDIRIHFKEADDSFAQAQAVAANRLIS